MLFAEEKTFEYIRHHHSNFYRIHVLEILPELYCLTTSDQDRLRASFNQWGNKDTIWEVFDRLRRRVGWVQCLIRALRACEHTDLADEIARVYQQYLPRPSTLPTAPVAPAPDPTEAPGPSAPAVALSSVCNSCINKDSGHPVPVQDTRPLQSQEEGSERAPLIPSSGANLREAGGLLESSDMAARSSVPSSGRPGQDEDVDSPHAAGLLSSPLSTRGPVSPAVSFQPLPRSTPGGSSMPGPPVPTEDSSSSSSTGLSLAGDAGGQADTIIYSSVPGIPASPVPTSTVPVKVPASPVPTSTVPAKVPASPVPTSTVPAKVPASLVPTSIVPSKLPTIPVSTSILPTSTVPSRVPISSKPSATVPSSPAPSRLPINLARAGTVPPRAPTGLAYERRMSASTAPAVRSCSGSAEEMPTGATAGGPTPGAKGSSGSWESEELSKPGPLVSQPDSQYSGTSADLAISRSLSTGLDRNNKPEENEYQSVETLRITVEEGPSLDLLEGNPRASPEPRVTPPLEEVGTVGSSPGLWAGALVAAAGLLLAVLLAQYRRRLLQ